MLWSDTRRGHELRLATEVLQAALREGAAMLYSGKDKGGPSKGGFLNNRLFS